MAGKRIKISDIFAAQAGERPLPPIESSFQTRQREIGKRDFQPTYCDLDPGAVQFCSCGECVCCGGAGYHGDELCITCYGKGYRGDDPPSHWRKYEEEPDECGR